MFLTSTSSTTTSSSSADLCPKVCPTDDPGWVSGLLRAPPAPVLHTAGPAGGRTGEVGGSGELRGED